MGFLQSSVFQDPEIVNAFSGAIAGALTATFVCPLDVLKTRLQVQRIASTQRVGILGGLAGIVQQEGVKGLYRGLTPTLMALLPNWAVYFTVYGRLKTTLTSRPGGRSVPATPAIHMAAAAGAGVATLLVTNPLWVVKTRLQTQHMTMNMKRAAGGTPYRGTFDALARITREEGLRGLYSGLAPSMAGICHVAIQFPLYEAAKVYAADKRNVRPDELSASELVLTSALSKMVASTITYPHEVVRSYMHVTGSGPLAGLSEACRVIFREDGMRGFYRGCATNLLRTTPAAALTFTSFELIARACRRFAAPQQHELLQADEGDAELLVQHDLSSGLDQQQPQSQQQVAASPSAAVLAAGGGGSGAAGSTSGGQLQQQQQQRWWIWGRRPHQQQPSLQQQQQQQQAHDESGGVPHSGLLMQLPGQMAQRAGTHALAAERHTAAVASRPGAAES